MQQSPGAGSRMQPQPGQSKNQTQAFTGIVANVACCNARD